MRALADPCIIKAREVRLRNFVTEQVVSDEIMNAFANGEVYIQTREVCSYDKEACRYNSQA